MTWTDAGPCDITRARTFKVFNASNVQRFCTTTAQEQGLLLGPQQERHIPQPNTSKLQVYGVVTRMTTAGKH